MEGLRRPVAAPRSAPDTLSIPTAAMWLLGCSSAERGLAVVAGYRPRPALRAGRRVLTDRAAGPITRYALEVRTAVRLHFLPAVPETPVTYDDAEVLEVDGLGFTVRIGNERVFVGKYVALSGTTIRAKGDRGRLTLPRWFVDQRASRSTSI